MKIFNLLKKILNDLSSKLGFNIFSSITLSIILLISIIIIYNTFFDNYYLDININKLEDDESVKSLIDECDNKDYL